MTRYKNNSAEFANVLCAKDPNYKRAREIAVNLRSDITMFQVEALFISVIGIDRLNAQSLISRLRVAGLVDHIKCMEVG